MKILIAYYSRTDTTKEISEELSGKLGAQLAEIKSPELKRGFWGFLKAGKQAVKKTLPVIEEMNVNVEDFDLILIGTPIWAGTIASPIRTFLTKNNGRFKDVAFFCTCGDSQSRAFDEMGKLSGKNPKAVLQLNRKEIKKNYQGKITEFIDVLKT